MKNLIVVLILAGVACAARAQKSQPPVRRAEKNMREDHDDALEQMRYEWLLQRNPKTGSIPAHIRTNELNFAKNLPTLGSAIEDEAGGSGGQAQSSGWALRGPYNIGGRTRALGIDAANENVILAAGVGGGMWRSTDIGGSWSRVSTLDMMPGISSLAQDTRHGKTNTWYCGTGEFIGSENYPNSYSYYFNYPGNGIYKTTDDGLTWFLLRSTYSSDSVKIVQPFNGVYNIVTDPTNDSENIVYAATIGGIERSTDGGATWNMTLGDFTRDTVFTDIAITKKGVLYAAVGSQVFFSGNYLPVGVYRSTDGIHWANISSTVLNYYQPAIVSLGVAPSDENVVYIVESTGGIGNELGKYEYQSGDGSGSGGTWTDLTANIPQNFNTQGGYDMYVRVNPADENIVYLGGMNLYRSSDGFATPYNVTVMNDTSSAVILESTLHVDEHALVFFPSNPSAMLAGCDGGVYMTHNDRADSVAWTPLNNGYCTTQFYRVAVDHGTPGSTTIIGGMQDNGTTYSLSASPADPWGTLSIGDGMTTAISDSNGYFYFSTQYGFMMRVSVGAGGKADTTRIARVDPFTNGIFVWTNPFVLDPNDSRVMYSAGDSVLWRNSDVTQIPDIPYYDLFAFGGQTTNWTALSNSDILTTTNPYDLITAIGISHTPANRVYYGTQNGEIFRLDNANSPDATPIDITYLPSLYSFVNCIAVDPQDAGKIIVVYSNYGVQSLIYSNDGGLTWTPVGGNLEQFPDGSGDGPSCRWASILHVPDGVVYLVGTSTGLYATSQLSGMKTTWLQEGASAIGNNIIDMMDARQSDGFVAVATHGAGVFSGFITSTVSGVGGIYTPPSVFALERNYPDPFGSSTDIVYTLPETAPVSLQVYDRLGREVRNLASGTQSAGTHTARFFSTGDLPDGVYFYRLQAGKYAAAKQMVLLR